MTIATPRLLLRPLEDGDAERIWPYVSDPETSQYMSWDPHDSIEVTRAFIADVRRRASEGTTKAWIVADAQNGEVVGLVSLIAILRKHRALTYNKAELAYWIGRPFRGRGYATEATRAVLGHAFGSMSLNKVTVAHASKNDASRKLIERLGFRRIGIERQHFEKGGEWIDHVTYELLASDWSSENG